MTTGSIWSQRRVVAGRWTLKDVVQGKPFGHPSHPPFVHFPSALLPSALIFDLASRLDPDLTFTRAAFYNIVLGLVVAMFAAITGLVDYLPMVGGSRKKIIGTRHLIAQLCAVSLFALSLLLRTFDFYATQTPLGAMIPAVAGAVVLTIGNYFGGTLVYRQGMRVSTDL
ncbi:MAG: DUF2231 domain-containing protein [Chloroflexi bacterium]|nr:MAG: DUF2231 domain-containing protein [Chloroflexota bacterium]